MNLQDNFKHNDTNEFKTYLNPPIKSSMFCSPVSLNEINKIINNLRNNKSPGPDNITSKLVKSIKNEILQPLAYLYNLSFTSGTVPNALKLAKVIPVFKNKGDRFTVNNYRPISLLNVFDKIMEKLMYTRIYDYLSVNPTL